MTPLWFLASMVIWETVAEVARRLRLASFLPFAAIAVHFACYANNCRWPFWRDGAFVPMRELPAPFAGYVVPTMLSRTVTYWWLYAAVPCILPRDFPLVLPGESLLHWVPRPARTLGLRVAWACVAALIFWQSTSEGTAFFHSKKGEPPPSVPFASATLHAMRAYGCSLRGCKVVGATTWSIALLARDAAGCTLQVAIAVSACAWAPRTPTPFARIGQHSLVILCMHEYALSVLDYPIAHWAAAVTGSPPASCRSARASAPLALQ